jgi:hypothetical protein
MGLAGLKQKRAGDEELVCITMTDSSAVGAIQCMTGCTQGKGKSYPAGLRQNGVYFRTPHAAQRFKCCAACSNPKALKTRLRVQRGE